MRVTVEFDDQKLADMMRLTGAEREDRAVTLLVEESLMVRLRRQRLQELVANGGIDFPELDRPTAECLPG